MKFTHDVIVIGGGAGGLTAAGGCALFGLKVALIEGHKMGGECLNNGCVPSKALLAAAKRAAVARTGESMGVTIAPPEIDWTGVMGQVRRAIADIEHHDSVETFEEMGCEVILGEARLTGRHSVAVAGRDITAPRIVLATGSRPFVPPIAGIEDVPYLTNETLFELDRRPDHLVIVGGGNIGMEMAQAFRRLGSEVTLIEPDAIMGRDDPESVAVVVEALREEGVRFVEGKAKAVSGSAGALRIAIEGADPVEGTHLLIATGRTARVAGFGAEELGLALGQNGFAVDKRRRTSLRSIYAIGDCREGVRLTHVAGYEGSNVALEIVTGLPTKVDYSALPWCTYTDPEVAQIGLTEKDARARFGDKITVVREAFSENERAVAEGACSGHIKLILKGKKLVGASVVGDHAGEFLLPLAQSITGKTSTFALGSAIIAYPTRSEILKAAAFTAWEPTVFGSLPKKYAALVAGVRRRLA